MNKRRIQKVRAFEFLDSRGNPTVAVEVETESGVKGLSIVPAGASKGKNEAVELRDGDKRFNGKGVKKAISNVEKISKAIEGKYVTSQREIDISMIELDGTENKSKLGANAILGVSMACAKAASNCLGVELFEYLGGKSGYLLPVPFCNVINGGEHAGWNIDFQEYMIVPAGFSSFADAIRCVSEIFHKIKDLAQRKGWPIGVGDEGGFALPLRDNKEAFEVISKATDEAGYKLGDEVFFAIDVASSSFYNETKKTYRLKREERELDTDEMIDYIIKLTEKYPIISIEDPLSESDWEGWQKLTRIEKNIQIVGDDIFTTNPKIFSQGIKQGIANAILVKPNQIGTLTETIEVVNMAKSSGYKMIISHRSGDTEDTFIADLAVAVNSGQIKTGSLSRSERIAKYNRLIYIESKYKTEFAGKRIFSQSIS